jgi:hypothetical protein
MQTALLPWPTALRRAMLLLGIAAQSLVAFSALAGDIQVDVALHGELVVVDARFSVAATLGEVWGVLTDFDGMAGFISNLRSSAVVARSGNTLQVEQKGRADYGPWSFSFDTVREIHLTPTHEIRSRLVHGSMKKLDGTTTLTADGDGTQVSYHGESVPGTWVPPVAGPAFIAHETQEQFHEMRNEILRRKHARDPK